MCQRGLGHEVVGDAAGQLGQRVGGGRSDHEQVGVLEVWIGTGAARASGQRVERLIADEAFRRRRQNRHDLVPGLDEQAHQLARLVGGYASTYADEDASH